MGKEEKWQREGKQEMEWGAERGVEGEKGKDENRKRRK